jgi:DNA-binding XRE family transcriptional regulator
MASTTRGRHAKFSDIRRPMTAERRARIDAIKEGMVAAERLFELRSAVGVTQVELAERLGVSQGNVSELERRDDLFLSTLRGYVESLGGRLEIAAVFPDEKRYTIAVGQHE